MTLAIVAFAALLVALVAQIIIDVRVSRREERQRREAETVAAAEVVGSVSTTVDTPRDGG